MKRISGSSISFVFLIVMVLQCEASDFSFSEEQPRRFSLNSSGYIESDPDPSIETEQDPHFVLGASPPERTPLNGSEKFRYYLKSTYGPKCILSSLAGSGIRQARDSVPAWGQGMEGYGKRFASSFGRRIIKQSVQMGVGALLHEDPRYVYSNNSGIWRRSLHATGRTFVAQKDSGGVRPAYSRFIGAFSSAYISRQWYPEEYRTVEDYLSAGAISIGFDVAKNICNEFWPDLKKMLRR